MADRNRLQSASKKIGDLKMMAPEELAKALSVFERLNGAVLKNGQTMPRDLYQKKMEAPDIAPGMGGRGTFQEENLSKQQRSTVTRKI